MTNKAKPRGGEISPATQRAALEAAATLALSAALQQAIRKGYTLALVPGGNPAVLLELCEQADELLNSVRLWYPLSRGEDAERWRQAFRAALASAQLEPPGSETNETHHTT